MAAKEEAPNARCPRCGAAFGCAPEGACWCARLPRKVTGPAPADATCLCPRCLAALLSARLPTD